MTTIVGSKSKNGLVGAGGGSGALGAAGTRGGLPKIAFRAIPPAAVGAKVSGATGSGAGGVATLSAGLKRPAGKGGSGNGSGARGPFGRLNDSSREDRILEGMAPDGGGDMEGAV